MNVKRKLDEMEIIEQIKRLIQQCNLALSFFHHAALPVRQSDFRGDIYLEGTVCAPIVNVREQPSLESPVVMQVYEGDTLILASYVIRQGGLYFGDGWSTNVRDNAIASEFYAVYAINGVIEPELKSQKSYIHINMICDIRPRGLLPEGEAVG